MLPVSQATREYQAGGNGIRNVFAELSHLEPPHELDRAVTQRREQYMDVVLKRPTMRNRLVRKQQLRQTEAAYIGSVQAKIAAEIDCDGSPAAGLELRQVPLLLEKASFRDGQPVTQRDFAANHLHILLDTALREHAARRQLVTDHTERTVLSRIKSNRKLHLGVAVGIFILAVTPELITVPEPEEHIAEGIKWGLTVASGGIFAVDFPEVVRLEYLDHKHRKETDKMVRRLKANKHNELDLAARMVYGSPHYGS